MVKATITYKDGTTETVYARDYTELFKNVDTANIEEFHAQQCSVWDMRQGR